MTPIPLLTVEALTVRFPTDRGELRAVTDVSFDVSAGQRVAVVGESGSGKSVTALSLLGLTPPPAVVTGSVRFKGRELIGLSERELASIRGRGIGLILQDASAALDPLKSVGDHISEALHLRRGVPRQQARQQALELVRQVRISDPELRVRQLSYELSGGMAQRAVTASVLALQPELIVADEPTSALDATTAQGVLELLTELGTERGLAVLLITHDLGIVSRFAEKVIVMYAGRIVEQGPTDEIFGAPTHPYTRGLLASVPGTRGRRVVQAIPSGMPDLVTVAAGCSFAPRCTHGEGRDECTQSTPRLMHRGGSPDHQSACHFATELPPRAVTLIDDPPPRITSDEPLLAVEGVTKRFAVAKSLRRGEIVAVDRVSLAISPGEVVALVGESGSGKSTLGRMILGLEEPTDGVVKLAGVPMQATVQRRPAAVQRRLQIVFQNPNSSLDPRMRVGDIIAEPLREHRTGTPAEQAERVRQLLVQVGLDVNHAGRFPFEFSGGQRQRIAIARALAPRPDLLICDEPLTALDVSVQAQILNLLQEIQANERLAYLFIAHDLAVVRQIADRVAVMYLGNIVETAHAGEFFASPAHPYSAALLSAMAEVGQEANHRERIVLQGAIPSPLNPPSGCAFHTRCWKAEDVCRTDKPTLTAHGVTRAVACHFPESVQAVAVPAPSRSLG